MRNYMLGVIASFENETKRNVIPRNFLVERNRQNNHTKLDQSMAFLQKLD
jgi:hypothetical protein